MMYWWVTNESYQYPAEQLQLFCHRLSVYVKLIPSIYCFDAPDSDIILISPYIQCILTSLMRYLHESTVGVYHVLGHILMVTLLNV